MTAQQKIKSLLKKSGLPSKEIEVYGRQIMVTAWSREAADKWADLISKFATVRSVFEGVDDYSGNETITTGKRYHDVWRVAANI